MKFVFSHFLLEISMGIIIFGRSNLAEICKDHTFNDDLGNMHRNKSAEHSQRDITHVREHSEHGQNNPQNESCVWPKVMMAIFVSNPTPFLEEQLAKLLALDYPKRSMDVFLYNNVPFHTSHIDAFRKKAIKVYGGFKEILPGDGIPEHKVFDLSLDYWIVRNCDYYFAVKSIVHLDNPLTLKFLVKQNKTVSAPHLLRFEQTKNYTRNADRYRVHGYKNIGNCYLISSKFLEKYDVEEISYLTDNSTDDVRGSYMSHGFHFGHLVDSFYFDINKASPEMYEIFTNPVDWEARYISREYFRNFYPGNEPLQPCPGVYWFPVVTTAFCKELIHMAQSCDKWTENEIISYLENDRERPSRSVVGEKIFPFQLIPIQFDWESHCNTFLRKYVFPLWEGFVEELPWQLNTMIGRYKSYEQSSLEAHEDNSTYSINLALNQRGSDYKGGGCRFLRDNCSVIDTRPGWLLVHDGSLKHEGLLTSEGSRYIMVSFIKLEGV